MNINKRINKTGLLIALLFFFAIVYALISLVNHYCFRTYALDLGAYTNAMFDYMNFRWNDATVFLKEPVNLLADHFDLYLIIFSPLQFVFGTYTLLIVQIASILFGAFGVYKYILMYSGNQKIALAAMISFLLFFGIFSALAFDYHSNVVATMLIPWFFIFIRKKEFLKASLFYLLVIIAKENMSLWMLFICLGLIIEYRKEIRTLKFLLILSVLSLLYFYSVINLIMPAISGVERYVHFDFSILGETPAEALWFVITHPLQTFEYLFINHTVKPEGDYIKTELHLFVLLSGGFLLFFRPQYLLMLVPVYFQKMMHDDISKWGVHGQYAIEFAPVVIIGAFVFISDMQRSIWKKLLLYLTMVMILAVTIRRMDNTIAHSDTDNFRIYQAAHYKKPYELSAAYDAFHLIPPGSAVSTQSMFLPHLSLRDEIYQFPVIKNAEYIIISELERTYPMERKEFDKLFSELLKSENWTLIYNRDGIFLFQRNQLNGSSQI